MSDNYFKINDVYMLDDGHYWTIELYDLFVWDMDKFISRIVDAGKEGREEVEMIPRNVVTITELPVLELMRLIGHDKNKALLYLKHDCEIVRYHCKQILKRK